MPRLTRFPEYLFNTHVDFKFLVTDCGQRFPTIKSNIIQKVLLPMYESLLLPWSENASAAESTYRTAGLVKTQGTIFLFPPSREVLTTTFNSPPKMKSRMSAGAVALCKHFERGGASSEHGRPHPFWPLPRGSNEKKSLLAAEILERMFDDAKWRNVMMLHPGVAVYEIRNSLGFGMRWTLMLENETKTSKTESIVQSNEDVPNGRSATDSEDVARRGSDDYEPLWRIVTVLFRGFLEPIIGLDHELPSAIERPETS